MTCKQCGREIASDQAVCEFCQSEMSPLAEPPKKRRKFPVKAVVAAAVAVVAVVALILNMSTVVGSVIKAFGSDTEYYKYVELKSLKSGNDVISRYYGLLKGAVTEIDKKYSSEWQPIIGDAENDLTESPLPLLNFSWLNGTTWAFTGNHKDSNWQFTAQFTAEEGEPFQAVLIRDTESGDTYLGLPTLSEEYLKLETGEPAETTASSSDVGVLVDPLLAEQVKAALPSEKKVNELLDRYLSLVLDQVEVATKTDVTLTVDTLQETCTQMDITVSEKAWTEILITVLTKAKEDKDIQAILKQAQAVIQERWMPECEDVYAWFTETINRWLDELRVAAVQADDKTALAMTVYINEEHEVIGRRVTVEGVQRLYYATVQEEGRYAVQLNVDDMALHGVGTKKGSVVSGEYDIAVGDMPMATLSVSAFDEGKAATGNVTGSFVLRPQKALWQLLSVDEEVSALNDLSVEWTLDAAKNKMALSLKVYQADTLWFGVEGNSKTTKAETVKIPETAVDVTDEEAMAAWAPDVQGDTVLEKLTNADLPEELMQWISVFVSNGEN